MEPTTAARRAASLRICDMSENGFAEEESRWTFVGDIRDVGCVRKHAGFADGLTGVRRRPALVLRARQRRDDLIDAPFKGDVENQRRRGEGNDVRRRRTD